MGMDALALTNYARNLLGRLGQSGWRPYWGWGLGTMLLLAVKFALLDAPMRGIVLPESYYNFLLAALGVFVATFVTREVGKHLERQTPAPGGGLVNNEAIA